MNKNQKIQSFTLIELLVVIAIVGILSGLIVLYMNSATESARIAKLKVYSNSVRDVLGNGLVSEWKFDEGTSTAAKDSWGIYDASLADTWEAGVQLPTWITSGDCISGSCLQFSDSGGDVVINNVTAFKYSGGTQEISISLWAKTDPAESTGYLIGKAWNGNGQYNYRLKWDSDNKVYVILGGATDYSVASNDVIEKNKWNHYFLSIYSDKTVKLYINSLLVVGSVHTITDWTPSLGDIDRTLTIGDIYPAQSGAQYLFNGKIDEVRIYNITIPVSQIRANYLAGLDKLLANGGITQQEYDQRIASLRQSISVEEQN